MHIDEFEELYEQYTFEKGIGSMLPPPKDQYNACPRQDCSVMIFVHQSPTKVVHALVSSKGLVAVPTFIQDHFR
ncbi:hypothetical protein EVB81_174 [Rhizobium phage RHph_I46]|uniref:Uncharacterized protein n=1 Tax=Rhizobium phage RHph_I1_9 TaxID=2509729 RepID=A0A7S5R9K1_9CAUD|nr:hypothetical protein PP936_gp173 [Rhizobium phage RHph_I1_9]QIG69743.1 hypothetical protein EVB81_174 [Rhizobium phage RHph_I46]QIG71024.1 hypothetical protein EVB92_174 [Rhizobium phage RHph_I9]QIG73610.1 hypothetical protein EVC04_173 [Rhizobium phage RHph_I1_9]QIG76363.1 hypothetical protein EVC25_174 [Rhizobium phage RHph_I34]